MSAMPATTPAIVRILAAAVPKRALITVSSIACVFFHRLWFALVARACSKAAKPVPNLPSALQIPPLLQLVQPLFRQSRQLVALVDVRLEFEPSVLLVLAASPKQWRRSQQRSEHAPSRECHGGLLSKCE
jgi:hypothetical protein